MKDRLIDSHIHLDMYRKEDREKILQELDTFSVDALIAVSSNLESSYNQLKLAETDERVYPAIGYHPEQPLPDQGELQAILHLIDVNHEKLAAVGEVGLPYYTKREQPDLATAPYRELLEKFIERAVWYNLPVILHAVYEDAQTALDLLEKYSAKAAHFHWFKGEDEILERILSNGYAVSVTPEVVYREKIQRIVKQTPLAQLMVETDGPWPFEEEFAGKLTHPSMIHDSIRTIAEIKQRKLEEVYREIYNTTEQFYGIQ